MTNEKSNREPDLPVSSSTGGKRSRWYAGYFLLALVNIATIAAGTGLNYSLVYQYENANDLNRYWSNHLNDYAELETLISQANAPGNDVFASLDPEHESRRLDAALIALDRKFSEMRAKHSVYRAPTHSEDWDMLIGEVEKGALAMSGVTRELLSHFTSGDTAKAGRSMAAMDRVYAQIAQTVKLLEREAQKQQRISLDEQVQLAERMRNIQYFIGALVGLLVVGVTVYGYRLARQMQRDDEDRAAQVTALEASEHRFRELTEGSIQGIIVHRDGVPLFVNDAWAQIHGFDDADSVRSMDNIANLISREDRESVRDIQYALQYGLGHSRQYEYRAKRRDDKTIWLACLERVVVWQGKPALQSTIIDVTERKHAEEGLREAMLRAEQATNARTRFFAAASHDLRQPLHAISLYLPLLLKRMEQSESREMLGAIQNSCNAMRSLLDSLLDISRLDAGVIEPEIRAVPLLDIFDQLGMEFTPQASAKGLELRVVPVDYWVSTDPALLERILRNLLTNAIRYTHGGKILLGARRTGSTVRVEVWDTGIGIPSETLGHVFEEFYQADNPERDRSRGLGLGLAIIERLATLLEHKLGVRSWPGRGSVFNITLPITEEPISADTQIVQARTETGNLHNRVAVLIDDDPIVLEGTQAMLEHWGCQVIATSSVSEAVTAVRAANIVPDFILADLRLRGGDTGLDAVTALHEALAKPIPAVIVTGDTDPIRIRQASASGHIIMHKPVEPARLEKAIQQLIQGTEPESPSGEPLPQALN